MNIYTILLFTSEMWGVPKRLGLQPGTAHQFSNGPFQMQRDQEERRSCALMTAEAKAGAKYVRALEHCRLFFFFSFLEGKKLLKLQVEK